MDESSTQSDVVEWRERNGVWYITNWPYISRIGPMVRLESRGWAWVLNGAEDATYAGTLEEAQHDSLVAALAKLNPLIKGVQACAEKTAIKRDDLIRARRTSEMDIKWTQHVAIGNGVRSSHLEAQVAGRTLQVSMSDARPGDKYACATYSMNSMPHEAIRFDQVVVQIDESGGDHQAAAQLALERAKNRAICDALGSPAFEWHVTLDEGEVLPSTVRIEGKVIATDPGSAISMLALQAGSMNHKAPYVSGEAKALSGPEVGAVYRRSSKAFGHSHAVLIQPAYSEATTTKEET